VEFAVMKVHEGYAPVAAAVEAARLRFRPILMTSLAFILGVVPLAFSHGAVLRHVNPWEPAFWVACSQRLSSRSFCAFVL
jgi:multidrug efflux pump subunit AcrB